MVASHLVSLIVLVAVAAVPLKDGSHRLQQRGAQGLEQQLEGDAACGSECDNGYFNLLQRAARAKLTSAATGQAPAPALTSAQRGRLIFVAGLEGSGHHLLQDLCDKLEAHFPVKSFGSPDDFHKSQVIPGIGCRGISYDAKHYVVLRQKMQELNPQYVHMLPRMMSYPSCGGSRGYLARRDFMHPHMGFFARAADEAGFDLHVLFLYRPIKECLRAGCLHRLFEDGDCEKYAHILVSNAGILLRQLKGMGGSRVHCFRYDSDLASKIAAVDDAFGPRMNSSSDLHDVFKATTHKRTENLSMNLSEEMTQAVHRANTALEQACQGLLAAPVAGQPE